MPWMCERPSRYEPLTGCRHLSTVLRQAEILATPGSLRYALANVLAKLTIHAILKAAVTQ
jgi:hypothetical protein